MNRQRQFATWSGVVLRTICALFLLSLAAHASDHRGAFTEEFHQTYALTPDGRVELDNINGAVHISSWDRNEVKVDAVKYADTKERLDEARIEVDSGRRRVHGHGAPRGSPRRNQADQWLAGCHGSEWRGASLLHQRKIASPQS